MRRALFALLAGCAFGGSNEDPSKPVLPPLDAQVVADARAAPESGAIATRRDAALHSCTEPAAIAVCDPVRNTGCFPLSQCDVDPSAATPSGRCVLYALPLAMSCESGPLSTTCPSQSTCDDGTCRPLCYCDDDCGAGQCCRPSTRLSAPFAVCQPC